MKKRRYSKIYYCKVFNCNNEICYNNFKYGQKQCRSCSKKLKNHPFFNKHHTEETKKILSKRMSGENNPLGMKNKHHVKESKLKMSKKLLELWQTKEFRENNIKAVCKSKKLSPNKPEKCLNKLLNKLFLKEYKFVGDGKLVVGCFCPDFVNINGQKKIIELYGDYWHNLPEVLKRDKRRKITYTKYGYKTLIIWEHELKDLNKVENKIKDFHFDKI